ncbi:MAG TPA: protein kinase, partial [Pyrinomonadaceae bacterium]|nr:protein kinase [Pyrinomonadaceae bacterium]
EADGQPFFTMEYVEGATLDTFIRANGLDLKTFLGWFIRIADALSHAHEKGIVHRDIKPGNIMITADGVPKILDFGLAQIDKTKSGEDVSTIKTHPGQILGTPSYMSPEQAEGKEIDECSDVFSLGVVMYEAITGRRPFKGDSYASIVSELLTKKPRSVTEIKPDIPFLLARLIMRCLEKERRKRFGSMREVRTILEEIEAAIEAGISMDSDSNPLLRRARRFSRGLIFAPVALLILLAIGFAFYYFMPRDYTPPISFENVTLRKLSQTSNVVYAHITPDGKSVAYNTIEEDEKRALWIRRVEDKNALQLLPPQPVFFWGGLSISTDGSQIYYITAERGAARGTLYRISSLGGTPRRLVETVNDVGSLSPNGHRILYVRYGDKKMQLLSANTFDGSDEREILSTEERHIYRDPQFSVDGRKVFFIRFEIIRGEEYWSLVEISATGGEERVIIPARKPKISELAVLKDGNGLIMNAVDEISNLPQIFHVSIADGRETRITNDLNAYFGISVSDDDKTIVAAQRQFAKDIWVVSNEDARQAKKLTNESNINSNAVWTPDGKIVFDAIDNNRPHIWIMNGDGSEPQQLTPHDSSDSEPQVSPDGRFIVFTSERTGEKKIWRMNIDGSNAQLLTAVDGRTFGPIILPDGKTVVFRWNRQDKQVVGRVPLAEGEVTEQSFLGESYISFSPDGKQVAFVTNDGKHRKVCVRPIDATEPLTFFDISPINFLHWSQDGKGLLFRNIESFPESNSTVWLQPLTGSEPKPFLSVKPDSVFNISLSSDGRQTAVVRGKLLTDAVMLTKIQRD